MSPTEISEGSLPLLRTKFFIPAQRAPRLARPRLFELLDVDCPLTLVSAPAGFGKTTLVSDWLAARDLPVGWLSLDPADSEPRRFLSYLATAVGEAIPGAGEELLALLRTPQLPPAETLLTPLINELTYRAAKWVLVLDDFHVIDHPEVHHAVEMLAHRLPPGVRIMVTTRVEPPLPLTRMRTQGLLQEVRAEDLRFNDPETAAFLAETMGLTVAPSHTATLVQRTEGWITGLQLAALSLRRHRDVDAFVDGFTDVDGFTETHRYVLDYLAEEVLAGLTPEVIDFLLATSIVERLCGPLCDALTDLDDGQARLEDLETANLFVIPLDDHRAWYRFHHLFRSFLGQQLEKRCSAAERIQLHRRACDWLKAEGLIDEALEHALAAHDQQRCLDLVEEHAEDRLRRGDVGTVMRWFDALPQDWIASRARLVIDHALVLLFVLRWREVAECLEISKRLLADQSAATDHRGKTENDQQQGYLAGKQAALESFLATTLVKPERAIHLARMALEKLPEDDMLLRGSAAVNLGSALIRTDAYDEARRVLRDAMGWHRASGDRLTATVASHLEGQLEVILGRLHGALEHYRQTRLQVTPPGLTADPFTSLLLVGEAEVHLEWGDLDRAQELAEQAVELSREVFPIAIVLGLSTLVGVHRGRRDPARATDVVCRLEQILESASLPEWRVMSETHRARVWCLEMDHFSDRRAQARLARWVDEHGLLKGDVDSRLLPDKPREAALMCALRLLIKRGEDAQALELSSRLRTLAEAKGWHRAQIESWLLEGRALRREPARAQFSLRRALQLAAPEGYLQVLADEGSWLVEMLDSAPNLLNDLPAEFQTRISVALGVEYRAASPPLPEHLSSREVEVLTAVAQGLSNAETGQRLHIAPSTVKKHLENIYGKLGAHNRVEAIARCRSLGLLVGTEE